MSNVVPIQRGKRTKSVVTEPTAPDIHTSQLPPRLAEDGDHVRSYPVVHHDMPATERKLSFGRSITIEPLSVSRDNAIGILATVYGYDCATAMVYRAESTGEVIDGQKFNVSDSQHKTAGKWCVTTDKTREDAFMVWANILRQRPSKSR